MAIIEIVATIGNTLTSIVMISAIGLMELMMQNRYGRVKDRVFVFIEYRNRLQQNKAPKDALVRVESILGRYSQEVKYIKNAMITGFLAISGVGITTVLLLTGQFYPEHSLLEGSILFVFTLSIIMLVISSFLMVISLRHSQKTADSEINAVLPATLLYCND